MTSKNTMSGSKGCGRSGWTSCGSHDTTVWSVRETQGTLRETPIGRLRERKHVVERSKRDGVPWDKEESKSVGSNSSLKTIFIKADKVHPLITSKLKPRKNDSSRLSYESCPSFSKRDSWISVTFFREIEQG